jgi:hypothetical protein
MGGVRDEAPLRRELALRLQDLGPCLREPGCPPAAAAELTATALASEDCDANNPSVMASSPRLISRNNTPYTAVSRVRTVRRRSGHGRNNPIHPACRARPNNEITVGNAADESRARRRGSGGGRRVSRGPAASGRPWLALARRRVAYGA